MLKQRRPFVARSFVMGFAALALAAAGCDMAAAYVAADGDSATSGGDGGVRPETDGGTPAPDSGGVRDASAPEDGGCDCPSGCCAAGACRPGTEDTECGRGGSACADCAAGGTKCVDQACTAPVACERNSDCPLGNICDKPKKTCVPGCRSDADCPQTGTSRCDVTVEPNGVCVECLADADCAGAGPTWVCQDGACKKGEPVCDPKCTAWEACGEDQVCRPREGYCNGDEDCTKLDPSLLCDLNTHVCVLPECVVDGDCGYTCAKCGGACVSNKCQCILTCGYPMCATCVDTSECEPGLTCSGLGTKKCYKMSCTSDADCDGRRCLALGGFSYCMCLGI
ncbi:MAG: hypothetical protein HY897_12435 [Deltaproteobacteria bacterium]|nr:hypothetical protein [Deltaproteobacteria bacterium]